MKSEADARLDAVLIGGREARAIVIVDYDPSWPERFEALAQTIRDAAGEKAVSVEHIGSTAVPGLSAKPIIDVLLTVMDVEDESGYIPALEDAGFVLRVREEGHRMLRTPAKDVHVHVFNPEDEAVSKYRDLRDWLRVDETDRTLYAYTKKLLARQRWSDMNDYADAKTDVISQILAHATVWRANRSESSRV
ncbi:GrpB family protein [Arthrobacter sp. AL08]|uniref:GrpB family protein n=1 Tax=Micrococcaceae TaxID=1268 RepID=UPI001CFFCFD3|nr:MULTISPECIES: GrpB family protein [Micrococcaceae]MCB5282023.1 Dephospho-CoA kinase [Arthrobacter sp. ES1]MDI3241018.1 GrpB family protein [Arthrobacter sp. AL05]MDI3277006.1 GrpB family protein [Arthrobacter sp. AL08]MDJ0352254.1 GrpB family protein [Pseudarthrobacter sp. PH31-O2]WGZ79647.1 GrpB family protein [Arthrobacter sp. EM1]